MTQFNPYKTFAHDGKALSQYKRIPDVECTSCHRMFNTTMELIDRETGRCESCQKEASQNMTVTTNIQENALTPVARYQQHVWPFAVLHTFKSASGKTYKVTIWEGKVGCEQVNGNPCESWKYRHTCHHATLAMQLEAERDAERTAFNNYELAIGA